MVADLPVTVTFSGTDYTGTMGEVTKEADMQDGGYLQQADAEVTIAQDDFSTAPVINDTFTINSVSYRVVRRDDDPSGAGYRFFIKRVK